MQQTPADHSSGATRMFAALLATGVALAQGSAPDPEALRSHVRAHRQQHEAAILTELRDLLALPNVASSREDIARNAALLQQMLGRRGMQTRLLTVDNAPPAVFGSLERPGATRTVVFYAHYDGQPVNPAQWATPPWTPTLRAGTLEAGAAEIAWDRLPTPVPGEYRIYGRSASDDKGPIVALLAALDALKGAGIQPSVNLKVFLEGEEEAGSPNLRRMLRAHAAALRADAWIFGDGPVHQTRQMLVSFGVRGTLDLEMTTYGPLRGVHSGHYGNWAPNPAVVLAHLLAGMRDTEGHILIDGVEQHVRPLSPRERAALDEQPGIDAEIARTLALGRTESVRRRLADSITIPALNVRGLRAADVGPGAVNAIPTEAQASIDFRLVPDLTPDIVRPLVEAHLQRRGYHVVYDAPDEAMRRAHPRLVRLEWGPGYPGHRTPMDLPVSRAIVRVVEGATGAPVVRVPNAGGSLPLYLFDEILSVPVVIVPIVNHDNGQHAANENLRVQNLWDGIEVYAALLAHLDSAWSHAANESPRP